MSQSKLYYSSAGPSDKSWLNLMQSGLLNRYTREDLTLSKRYVADCRLLTASYVQVN